MSNNRLVLRATMLVCMALFISISITQAQSTVFNTPSTDVISERQTYIELDFLSHLSSYEQDGFQLYGVRAVYGVRKHMEFGANIYYTRSADSPEPLVVEPNFKWQFYNNEDLGFSAAAGALISIPVSHRSKGNTSGFLYLTGSKKIKGDFGPRLSAGSYVLAVRAEPGTSKYGTFLGFEQPLNSRLTLISDWTSGKNELGYLAAGIGINLSSRSALYVGYNVGNEGRRNNALGIYYGFTF